VETLPKFQKERDSMGKQIDALRKLGLNDAEIADVLESDKRIDQGEKLFELTAEQKQAEKKAKNSGTHTVYNFSKRERKADNDKREIIQTLDDALCDLVDYVEVVNPEREILFTYNDKKYKIVLSAPRG
jgi:DNA repair ATPase RecN